MDGIEILVLETSVDMIDATVSGLLCDLNQGKVDSELFKKELEKIQKWAAEIRRVAL